jgi:hypothetical protein
VLTVTFNIIISFFEPFANFYANGGHSFANFAHSFASFAVKKGAYKQLPALLLFTLFILNNYSSFSQEAKEPLAIEDIAEELAADENDPDAASIFIEDL